MKKICFGLLVLLTTATVQAASFTKIVNTGDSIPQHSDVFSSFGSFAIEASQIVFQGYADNNHQGLYLYKQGELQLIVDSSTTMPGSNNQFGIVRPPYIHADKVVFHGAESADINAYAGIYLSENGRLSKIVDSNTAIPSGEGDFSLFGNLPVMDDNMIAFRGFGSVAFTGLYLYEDNTLTTVIDSNDTLPGFSELLFNSGAGIALDNGKLGFFGFSLNGDAGLYSYTHELGVTKLLDKSSHVPAQGVSFDKFDANISLHNGSYSFGAYSPTSNSCAEVSGSCRKTFDLFMFKGGQLTTIADSDTLVPDYSEVFRFFGTPIVNEHRVLFVGGRFPPYSSDSLVGVYLYQQGKIHKVVDTRDILQAGKTATMFGLSSNALDGSQLAFSATFDDGSQAVYLADLDIEYTADFSTLDNKLRLPAVDADELGAFQVEMTLIDAEQLIFALTSAEPIHSTTFSGSYSTTGGELVIPLVNVDGQSFNASLSLHSSVPLQFKVNTVSINF